MVYRSTAQSTQRQPNAGRVLVVEDEAMIAMALEMELNDMDYEAIGPAISTHEAERLLESTDIDGAILDVVLVDGEVFPIAEALKARDIPFVFHSGNQDPEELEQRFSAPSFMKPTHPQVLIKSLEALISKSSK